jgi:hypothetical protein
MVLPIGIAAAANTKAAKKTVLTVDPPTLLAVAAGALALFYWYRA